MMKDFKRNDPFLSLCGLNCGLCLMHISGHCGGCGFGNQSCRIARCSMEHGNIEYCFRCSAYPCWHYDHIDAYDSFITHRNQKQDFEKAQRIGIEAYQIEQSEKVKLLDVLLSNYNDGRRKTLYCVAVNLLEVEEIKEIISQAEVHFSMKDEPLKEKARYITERLQELAKVKNLELKLRKKRLSGR